MSIAGFYHLTAVVQDLQKMLAVVEAIQVILGAEQF